MTSNSLSDAPASPLKQKERILFLDAIRGIAVLGILIMNITAQGQIYYYYNYLNLHQSITGLNFYAWFIEMGFFEGTMRGLFSILFGAGTILLIERLERSRGHLDAADIYYRRILWLLVFGLINAFVFLWPGDILYAYALCGLVLFPFRKMSPKNLLIAALLLLVLGTYRETRNLYDLKETIAKGKQIEDLQRKKKKLTDEQKSDLEKWHSFRDEHSSKGLTKKADKETAKIQKANYAKLYSLYRDENMQIQSIGFYNSWWDMLMFFFIGMAFYKSGFLTGSSRNWIYVSIAIIGIGLGLTINLPLLNEQYRFRFDDVIQIQRSLFAPYQIRRLLQTLGYLSLLILLYKLIPLRRLFHVFVPVGQMAFTNYLSQSIITSIFFFGFGWFGKLQRYELYEVVAAIWLFQIAFSTIWLKYFLFGPFEWLWRSLTYKKLQTLKRGNRNMQEEVTPLS